MFAPRTVRVPASTANLAPGFDTLAVDEKNLIWKAAIEVAESQGREMPRVAMDVNNGIPIGKGLGSTASALIVGVAIANCVLDLE